MLGEVVEFIVVLKDAFKTIGGTLISIMFLYGALFYVYSADDPGGRKTAKSICIHAIIGGIIIAMAETTIETVGGSMGL
ncbi:MAG TPA: hypothetical protein ENN13_02535 [Candidatus Altiarchaeales archaeon]|nr:hypothetical protein [Candidatus Altiarchaeales archaeon]